MVGSKSGGRVGCLKAHAHLLAILALASCGGQVSGSPGNADGQHDGGTLPKDTGTPESEAGVSLDTGTTDAALQCSQPPGGGGNCKLCQDGWHCGSAVLPKCSVSLSTDGCLGVLSGTGVTTCLACTSNGSGGDWQCSGTNWSLMPVAGGVGPLQPCSP
jgi:hypothetical protein